MAEFLPCGVWHIIFDYISICEVWHLKFLNKYFRSCTKTFGYLHKRWFEECPDAFYRCYILDTMKISLGDMIIEHKQTIYPDVPVKLFSCVYMCDYLDKIEGDCTLWNHQGKQLKELPVLKSLSPLVNNRYVVTLANCTSLGSVIIRVKKETVVTFYCRFFEIREDRFEVIREYDYARWELKYMNE